MKADLRWWRDDETDVAGAVFKTVRRIQQMQGDRITALLEALCLYDDWQALGLVLGDFAVRRTEIKGRLALNMIRSCCDTVHAEIIQSRPRPMFLTAGGDFTLRRKGERMGKFIEGVFSETDFDDIASQCALDALVCGYGAVRTTRRGPKAEALGVLRTLPADPLPQRLAELQAELRALLVELRPDVVAVERVFFQVNVRTAMSVGQASGLARAEAVASGAAVTQYSPNEVKLAVTGDGAADKAQVQVMVQRLLGLATAPSPPDAADAAALALCHLAHAPLLATIGGGQPR